MESEGKRFNKTSEPFFRDQRIMQIDHAFIMFRIINS